MTPSSAISYLSPKRENHFDKLPNELIIMIVLLVSKQLKDLASLAQTCRKFSAVVQDTEFWKIYLARYFPGCPFTDNPLQRAKDLKAGLYFYDKELRVGHLKFPTIESDGSPFFTQEGYFISKCENGPFSIWTIADRQPIATFEGHTDSVYSLLLTKSGQIISGASDTTIKIWDTASGRCLTTLTTTKTGWKGTTTSLALTPDGKLISADGDNTVNIWNIAKKECIANLKGHTDMITSLVVTQQGKVISGSEDMTIRIWDIEKEACIATLTGHTGWVTCLVLTKDGKLISGSDDGTIRVWDIEKRQCIGELKGHTDGITCLVLTPGGKLISASYDNFIGIWDVANMKCLGKLEGHTAVIYALTITNGFELMSESDDDTIRIWHLPPSLLM